MKIQILTRRCRAIASSNIKILYLRKGDNIMDILSVEEKKEIKNKLLDAARTLFLQFGINKTNIVDITDKAGVGKGTFYTFFKSKGDIYMQLYSEEWTLVHHVLDEKYKFRKESNRLLRKISLIFTDS